ncbi:MAG: vanadium-dependent haloperoxidase [Saprospiraceae bacterium]|uniref:Vanadium-dependent haloperoxidase n=1 Tax=Candidatus Opimibacter skivensis TaxID=2982028 RepID=A0A9D7T1E2_9BACT|nr:vanadium-dependent haloperoxidase [Candidatus Opimibacter skivensis]
MRRLVLLMVVLGMYGCKNSSVIQSNPFGVANLHQLNRRLLEIAMEDGYPPPIASRVYVYPHIAYFVTIQKFYPDNLPSIAGKLNGLTPLDSIKTDGAHAELTANLAFCKIAKKLIFSEHYMDEMIQHFLTVAKEGGLNVSVIGASEKCSDEIAHHLISWISKDKYVETRTMDRWTSTKKRGEWVETPPDYAAGLEPHWAELRPLLIDSASIFKSTPPPSYDPGKNSEFFKMVNAVYLQSKDLNDHKKEIAMFWDDNPNTSEYHGHLVAITHKIAPPGHWLNIINQISTKENSDLFKTTKSYTYSAIAMYDAIISCWYEKYKTNLVRPITYIQENIDINWKPLIQTPPFPEYTSGHSAISAAAATILTSIYGDNYAFTDSTEILFEQPVRSFPSFQEAAWEVSLSRFYAGIHYMNGVQEGNRQGIFIGQIILEKLR